MARSIIPARLATVAAVSVLSFGAFARDVAAQAPPVGQNPPPGAYAFTAADVQFITGMISHHAQALVMAGWAPSHGANPSVRVLCERIINAQNDEITLMQNWLRDRNQPVPDAKPAPMKMMMGGMEHEMMMPGMLSDVQMQQLDSARGVAFDRLFLTYMIQHHRGALTMVDQLFASPGAAEEQAVFKFASNVYADQGIEIARMEQMLAKLPAN